MNRSLKHLESRPTTDDSIQKAYISQYNHKLLSFTLCIFLLTLVQITCVLQILDPCHQLNFTVVQYLAVILIDHPLVAQETYSKCDVVVVSFIWHFCSIIQSLIKKKSLITRTPQILGSVRVTGSLQYNKLLY